MRLLGLRLHGWIWIATLRQLFARSLRKQDAGYRLFFRVFSTFTTSLAFAWLFSVYSASVAIRLPTSTLVATASTGVELLFAGITVVVLCALTDDVPIRQALSSLPVPRGTIALGLVLPVLAVEFTFAGLAAPTLILYVHSLSVLSVGVLISLVTATTALGMTWGVLLASAARLSAKALNRSRSFVYPLGLAALLALAALQLLSIRGDRPGWGSWAGLVPLLLKLEADPSLRTALPPIALLLLALAVWFYSSAVPFDIIPAGQANPLLHWSPSSVAPLYRMELIRLGRQVRFLSSTGAVALLSIAGLIWCLTVRDGSRRTEIFTAVLTISCIALVHPFLLIRSYSPRLAPPQVAVLGNPAGWLARISLAGCLYAVPQLAALSGFGALRMGDAGYLALAVGVSMLSAGSAILATVAKPLKRGNIAGEAALLLGLGAGVYGVVVAGRQVLTGQAGVGIACGVLGAGAWCCAAVVEARRWRALTGPAARDQPAARSRVPG